LVLEDRTITGAPGARPGTDRGTNLTGLGNRRTFFIAENAQITLEGRQAELKDVKPGVFAWVHLYQVDRPLSGTSGKEKDVVATDKGVRLTAQRVEAFVKDPGFLNPEPKKP